MIGTGTGQVIMTRDPQLSQRGLPPYPPLPATMDATKIDEIRRTIFVENLAPGVSYIIMMYHRYTFQGRNIFRFFTEYFIPVVHEGSCNFVPIPRTTH